MSLALSSPHERIFSLNSTFLHHVDYHGILEICLQFNLGIDYTEMRPEMSLVTIVNKLILVPIAGVQAREPTA